MRVTVQMTPGDLAAVDSGKPIVLAFSGMESLALHFDPIEEEREPPSLEKKPPVIPPRVAPPAGEPPSEAITCDCCNRAFKSIHSRSLHYTWMKRKAPRSES